MKTNKILKVVCTAVIIVLLICIAFIGIFVPKFGRETNIVDNFELGLYLGGGRQVVYSPIIEEKKFYEKEDGTRLDSIEDLSEEEKAEYTEKTEKVANEALNVNNYKKVKDILKQRFDLVGLPEYQIRLDEESGKIIVNATENNIIDNVIYGIYASGTFEIKDSETSEVLLDRSHLDSATMGYNSAADGTRVYLLMKMNTEGAKKLEEISQIYVQSTQKVMDEEGNEKEETVEKTISLYINGDLVVTTYFGDTLKNGVIQLAIGSATTDVSEIMTYAAEASMVATTLSTEALPLEYEMGKNEYISSTVSQVIEKILLIVAVAIITAMIVYLIAEYRDRGIVVGGSFIGYVALLILVIRLADVPLTLESLVAIILSIILNYIFLNVLASRLYKYKENNTTPKSEISSVAKKSILVIIPAFILSTVFTLFTATVVSSFGAGLLWGLLLMVIYNWIITKPLLLNFEYLFEEEN